MLVPQRFVKDSKIYFMKNPTNGLADDLRPQKDGWSDGRGPQIRRNILLRKNALRDQAVCTAMYYCATENT